MLSIMSYSTIIFFLLQIKELMLSVVKCFTQGHMAKMGQRVDFEPRSRRVAGYTLLTTALSWWFGGSLFGPHPPQPPYLLTAPSTL